MACCHRGERGRDCFLQEQQFAGALGKATSTAPAPGMGRAKDGVGMSHRHILSPGAFFKTKAFDEPCWSTATSSWPAGREHSSPVPSHPEHWATSSVLQETANSIYSKERLPRETISLNV